MATKIAIKQDNEAGAEPTQATETGPAAPPHELRQPPHTRRAEPDSATGEHREAAIEEAPSAPNPEERRPAIDLLEHQLVHSAPHDCNQDMRSKLRHGTVDLYSSLSPKNASDSVLARFMVGLTNMSFDCLDRSQRSSDRAREVNLRYAVKGAATVLEVMKFYDARRERAEQKATDGNGKADAEDVGNAHTGDTEEQAPETESVSCSQTRTEED